LIRLIAAVILVITITGCSGIKPWKAPNHREEGPQGGLFSGTEGAWSIGLGGESTATSKPQTPAESEQK